MASSLREESQIGKGMASPKFHHKATKGTKADTKNRVILSSFVSAFVPFVALW